MTDIDMDAFAKCINLMQEIFGDLSVIDSWWEYPHPSLGNKKPRVAMVDGDIHRVLKLLQHMKNTEPS